MNKYFKFKSIQFKTLAIVILKDTKVIITIYFDSYFRKAILINKYYIYKTFLAICVWVTHSSLPLVSFFPCSLKNIGLKMFVNIFLLLFIKPFLVKSMGLFKQVLDFSDPGMFFSIKKYFTFK